MLKENGLTCLHDHTHCRLINHNWVKNIHVNMLTCCMLTDRSSQEQESKNMKTLHSAVTFTHCNCGWIRYSLTSASKIQRSKSFSPRDISIYPNGDTHTFFYVKK